MSVSDTDEAVVPAAPTAAAPSPDDQPVEPATPRRHRIPRWLPGVLISTICGVFGGRWVASQPTPHFPHSADAIALLALAAATTLLLAVLRGWRWRAILSAVGIRGLGIEPFTLTAVGYMGNTVLPARGGDLLRVGLLSRRRNQDWRTVTGTLVPERLLDVIALALMLLALTIFGAANSDLGATPGYFAAAGTVAIGLALFAYHELRVRGYFEGLADRIRPFTRATRVLLGRRGALLLLLTLGLWGIEVLVFWLVVDAAWEPLPLTSAAFVVVLASLATAIPAAPGAIGTFDAAVVFGLHAAGVPSGETFALAVLYRVVLFGPITVVGALILVFRYGGRNALRARAVGDGPDDTSIPATDA